VEFGLAVNIREPIEEIRAIVQTCINSDVSQVWVTDYPATRYSPIVAAVLAKDIHNMRFGIGLLSPLLHPVDQIKRTIKSLISRYGERFDILIGPGDRTALARIGVDYGDIDTLVSRLVDDAIEIKRYISERGFESRVFLAAQGSKMISESKKTDGVLLNYTSVEQTKWAQEQLGNVASEFIVSVFPPTFISRTNKCDSSLEIKRGAAMVILGLSQSVMNGLSVDESISTAKELHKKKGYIHRQVIDAISDQALQEFSICTTERELIKYLEKMKAIGTDMVVFGPPAGKQKETVEKLVSAVGKMST